MAADRWLYAIPLGRREREKERKRVNRRGIDRRKERRVQGDNKGLRKKIRKTEEKKEEKKYKWAIGVMNIDLSGREDRRAKERYRVNNET